MVLFTVGHSNHSIERFRALVQQHAITAIADVRSIPQSRLHPQFNRNRLATALKAAHVGYVFLGRELGARAEDDTCYEDGKVQYGRLAQTALFQQGLDRVCRGASGRNIALMCAERDPLTCHRGILLARCLSERGVHVRHIHADGRVEDHPVALKRLVSEHRLSQTELFEQDDGGTFAKAYQLRERRIAFRRAEADLPRAPHAEQPPLVDPDISHALTLIQPWAFAIEELGKRIENRSWTPPRWVIGRRIYVHAGMKCDEDSCEGLRDEGYSLPAVLPRRSIGSSAVVRGWVRPDGQFGGAIEACEVSGVLENKWYVPGEIAWVLDDVRLVSPRFEIAGQQGLWRLPKQALVPDLTKRILEARNSEPPHVRDVVVGRCSPTARNGEAE